LQSLAAPLRTGDGVAAAGGVRVGGRAGGVLRVGHGNHSVGELLPPLPSSPPPKTITVVVTVGMGLCEPVGRPGSVVGGGGWFPATVAVTVAVDVTMVTLVLKTVDTTAEATVFVVVNVDTEMSVDVCVWTAVDVTVAVDVTTDVDVTMLVATAVREIVVVSVSQTTDVGTGGATGELPLPLPPELQAPNAGLQPAPQ
jgi:hypothetical protein